MEPKSLGRRKVIGGLSPLRAKTTPVAAAESNESAATKLPFRIGHGYDIHRLQPGGKLPIGGVVVSEELSPVSHSDGDVVIHAVVDALLGAMGWGDIGDHFANTDEQWKGAASRVFLDTIYARVTKSGYRLHNLDITLMAEKPKISPHKQKIVESLRHLFGGVGAINLKACTNEGVDAIGRGEAIAASAVLLLAEAE
jgi:2-C-methyl-D-erythritol 2,4-cyclodiphosphate synthase